MAARLSTGLVKKMMDTSPFRTLFNLGFIDIYSGIQPASADSAASGTKLCTISNNSTGTGLTFEATAPAGVLAKTIAEVWSGVNIADGNAGWFRMREAGDTGVDASTTAVRYDGAISTSGAELNLGSVVLKTGAPLVISGATFTLPKS